MEGLDDYTYLLEMLDVDDYSGHHSNYSLEDFLRVAMDYEQEDHWFQPSEELCFILLFVFFIVLGLVGNGLVCFIIIRKGRRQSSRNWYILNLAVSDILTCLLCKPPTLVRLMLKNWPLGGALCKLVPSLQTVYVFVSTFTLVALAVDRYRAVMCPGQYSRVHVSPIYCLLLIWLLSMAIALPIFLVHRLEEVKGFGGYVLYTVCLEQWHSQTSLTVYTIFVLLLQYLSPLAAIVTLHLLIGNFLRLRIEAEGTARLPECQWQRKRQRHRKNMCLLTSMAASFAVSWLPLHVVNALASIDYLIFKNSNFPLIHAACMLLAFSSVCLNPVIYGLLNSNFRRDLQRMCVWRRRSAPPCRHFCGHFPRKGSRHTEQCGLISASPLEVSQSCGPAGRKGGDVISAV
ncbi:prolactin-releasing peptide receptor-like [Babylonia areolata]|uniref:prolactin-releasing peptide receptor-like n=1 Tax=Babylonia areolata TaxID=304850 RepID=UPI003FD4DA28